MQPAPDAWVYADRAMTQLCGHPNPATLDDSNGLTIGERGGHMPAASSSISWSHDLDSALTRAPSSQRPILVDFTAAPM